MTKRLYALGIFSALAFLTCWLLLEDALADDNMTVQTKISATGEYDSNILLSPSAAKATYGLMTSPELIIATATPTTTLTLDTRLDLSRFNQQTLSSNDVHTTYHGDTKGTWWQVGLDGTIDYDTTRTSEVTASGLNIAGIHHTGFSVSPQVAALINPTDTVLFKTSLLVSNYDNSVVYKDYRTYSVTPIYQRNFDPLNTGVAMIRFDRFETLQGPANAIDDIAFTLGWNFTPTPQLTSSVTGGYQQTTRSEAIPAGLSALGKSSTDYVFTVDIGYQLVADTIHLTAIRQPIPLASGTEVESTSFGLTETHRLSTHLQVDSAVNYQFSDNAGPANITQKYLVNASSKLVFHATESISFGLTLQYRQQELQGEVSAVNSRGVLLGVSYTPSQKSLDW